MGLWGTGRHSLPAERGKFWSRCRHIYRCGTGQDRVLTYDSVFTVNYKQKLLELSVQEVRITATRNSRSGYWIMKGDQLLYMHYLIEPPSQPSEVQLTLKYKFVNTGLLQYSNTAEKNPGNSNCNIPLNIYESYMKSCTNRHVCA